jgi:hypothetical protein
MKRTNLFVALVLVVAACAGGGPQSGSASLPGHGAITVAVEPNPIVARPVSGNTWDFPFSAVVRETGGQPVTITRVTATVFAPGNISLGQESWDAADIRARGYSLDVGANGELRYAFSPRKSVPDERLFGNVSAELRVDAVDASGTATTARTVVTITR